MILRFNFRHCNFFFTYRLIAHDKFHFFELDSWQTKFLQFNEWIRTNTCHFFSISSNWVRAAGFFFYDKEMGEEKRERRKMLWKCLVQKWFTIFPSEFDLSRWYQYTNREYAVEKPRFTFNRYKKYSLAMEMKSTFTSLPRYFFRKCFIVGYVAVLHIRVLRTMLEKYTQCKLCTQQNNGLPQTCGKKTYDGKEKRLLVGRNKHSAYNKKVRYKIVCKPCLKIICTSNVGW